MKLGLFGWSKHMGYTILDYQPENVGKHADVFRLVIESCVSPVIVMVISEQ